MADDRDTWLEHLSGIQLPVLNATKQRLAQALEHPATSHTDLGQIIVADPGLSLRLFRALADSGRAPKEAVVGNPTRIIGLLGQAALQALAGGTPTLEERFRGPALEGLKGCYSRALHAALFARRLATLRGRSQAEDDATAALLQGLGEMLVWARRPGTLQPLSRAARRLEELDFLALDPLGVCPSELGEILARRWGLPAAVVRAQRPHNSFDPNSQLVLLAANLAWSGLRDWQSEDTEELFRLAAELTHLDLDLVRSQMHREVANASRTAHALGLPHAGDRLLLPPGSSAGPVPGITTATAVPAQHAVPATPAAAPRTVPPRPRKPPVPQSPPAKPAARPPRPETPTETTPAPGEPRTKSPPVPRTKPETPRHPATTGKRATRPNPLQQKLTGLLNRMRDEQALERIMLALVNSDRSEIRARFVLEREKGVLTGFAVPARSRNLFSLLLAKPHALWINPGNQVKYLPHIPEQVAGLVDMRGFYLASLVVRNRSIGLLYADAGSRALDAQGFERFKQASRVVAGLFVPAG